MSNYYSERQSETTIREIILLHYKKVMEISCSEFVGGYYNYVTAGNITQKSYVTDKRAEFLQSIEIMALALYPHFDAQMKKDYDSYIKKNKELKEKFKNDKSSFNIEMLEVTKQLFQDLSCLLKRNGYLKVRPYSQGQDDDDDDDIIDVD